MKINKKFGKKITNLTSVLSGAAPIACNNEHFGRAENVLAPGIGKNMGDGWETRRKRNKGHDYLILKLGKPGKIHKVDIDTSYFNGNQPSKISLDACYSKNKLPNKNSKWINILKKKNH